MHLRVTGFSLRPNLAVALAAVPTAVQLAFGLTGTPAALLTLVGTAGVLALVAQISDGARPPMTLWCAVGVLAVLALVRAPLGSHDMWSYAFYGRMMSHYGVDPYNSVPAQFPHDVLWSVVRWRTTPSVYGPVFSWFSAAAMRLAGNSLLAMRLWFQGVGVIAILGCIAVLRGTRHTRTLVLFALAPFVWVSLVNGGHNDSLIAAGVVLAVIAFGKERWLSAGLAIAAVGLIKLTGLLVLVPLVVILVTRRRFREAILVSVVPVLALTASLVFVPASVENLVRTTKGRISRGSVWRSLHLLAGSHRGLVTTLATVTVLGAVIAISWLRRHDGDATFAVGSSASIFGFLSSYSLSWYQIWGLPTLALSGDVLATTLVVLRGSLMQASYELPNSGPFVVQMLSFALAWLVPPVLLVAFLRHVFTHSDAEPVEQRELQASLS